MEGPASSVGSVRVTLALVICLFIYYLSGRSVGITVLLPRILCSKVAIVWFHMAIQYTWSRNSMVYYLLFYDILLLHGVLCCMVFIFG